MRLTSKIIGGAFLISALVTAWARLALTYDGSYYLMCILESRQLLVPHNRVGVLLLTLPAQITIRLTEDIMATSLVFCTIYAIIPLASILACWLVVHHKQPELMIWPLISIGLLSIPVQPIQISENLIVCQLAWPLLLSVMVWRGRLATALNLLWAIFLVSLHPVSIVFLFLIAIAALIKLPNHQLNRERTVICSLFVILAIARLLALLFGGNAYEHETIKGEALAQMLKIGFSNILIVATGASLSLALVQLKTKELGAWRLPRLGLTLSITLCSLSATLLLIWSANLQCWYQSMHYGRFVFTAVVLLMAYATYESNNKAQLNSQRRAYLGTVIALIFLAASVVQSYQWRACTAKLQEALSSSKETYMLIEELPWIVKTPLDHWSSVPLALILQGRKPKTILLTKTAWQQISQDGTFKVAPWENAFTNSYFKLPQVMPKK